MENVVVLFAGFPLGFATQNSFDGKSSVMLSIEWAIRNCDKKIYVLSLTSNTKQIKEEISKINIDLDKFSFIEKDNWNVSEVASSISSCCTESDSKTAVYSWIDLPFLNDSLTKKMINDHTEFLAEYTYADGFPYGVSPEIVDSGTAAIISKLCEDKNLSVTRDALFSVMKSDINSFEIETILSNEDFRTLRLSFESSSVGGFASCKNLYPLLPNDFRSLEAEIVGSVASKSSKVLRTIPYFFDIQITSKVHHKTTYDGSDLLKIDNLPDMKLCDFDKILSQIKEINPDAVVSVSCFGEPLLNPDALLFVERILSCGLKAFVETDGLLIEEKIEQIKKLSEIAKEKLYWVIDIDGADSSSYKEIRNAPESDFEKAINSAKTLSTLFPKNVYPQMTRMNNNEEKLEQFFRFWKNADNGSNGNLIIKKYDSLCRLLPDEKPADLSPLERNPCWHCRRDFVILSDGSVPICRSIGLTKNSLGNAFNESLVDIWQRGECLFENHLCKTYDEKCGVCDEYYTFNF